MQRLAQTEDGDLALPVRLVSGAESVLAALINIFTTQAQDEMQATSDGVTEVVQGEWGFDKSHGIRWRGAVLRKYFSATDTRAVLADAASQVQEIETVSPGQTELTFDHDARRVLVAMRRVRLVSGETIPLITLDVAI